MRFKLNPNVDIPIPSGGQLFGAPRPVSQFNKTGKHLGDDYAYAPRTPLYNPFGLATFKQVDSGAYGGREGWLEYDDGSEGRATHLDSYVLANNARVAPGQAFGYSGSTGDATAPCVHWQRKLKGGDWQSTVRDLQVGTGSISAASILPINQSNMVHSSGRIYLKYDATVKNLDGSDVSPKKVLPQKDDNGDAIAYTYGVVADGFVYNNFTEMFDIGGGYIHVNDVDRNLASVTKDPEQLADPVDLQIEIRVLNAQLASEINLNTQLNGQLIDERAKSAELQAKLDTPVPTPAKQPQLNLLQSLYEAIKNLRN